jgi:hypothetical protein
MAAPSRCGVVAESTRQVFRSPAFGSCPACAPLRTDSTVASASAVSSGSSPSTHFRRAISPDFCEKVAIPYVCAAASTIKATFNITSYSASEPVSAARQSDRTIAARGSWKPFGASFIPVPFCDSGEKPDIKPLVEIKKCGFRAPRKLFFEEKQARKATRGESHHILNGHRPEISVEVFASLRTETPPVNFFNYCLNIATYSPQN